MSGVKAASRDALNKYQDLLNSFTLSFNRADRSLKDVTKVVNGLITIHDEDYGLEVKLPVKWHRDPDSPTPLFYNVDEGFIDFAIKSVVNNETAEEWRAAERAKLEKEFASDYIRNFEESTITLMNGQGQVLKYEYSWNKTEWITEYDVFYIAGDHKYSINFYSLKDDASKGKGLFETIVNSLSIDTEYVDSNFSEMEEDADLAGQVVKKSSKKYGYSIELPAAWTAEDKDFETESVSYDSKYGFFTLDIMEETSASQYASRYASYLSTEDGKASGMQLKQTTSTMINGMAVTRMDITIEGTTRAYNSSMYLIEKNNRLFILEFFVQQANDTPAYQDEVTKVLQSLTFS
jgi:predicted nucleic acid-binding protein